MFNFNTNFNDIVTLQHYLQFFKISEYKLCRFLCKNKNVIIIWLHKFTPDKLQDVESTIIKLSFVIEDIYKQVKSLLIELLKTNSGIQELTMKKLINDNYNRFSPMLEDYNNVESYRRECSRLALNEYLIMNYMLYTNYPCKVFINSNNNSKNSTLLQYWNGFVKLKKQPKLLTIENSDVIYCNENYDVEIDYFVNNAKNNIFCAISSSSGEDDEDTDDYYKDNNKLNQNNKNSNTTNCKDFTSKKRNINVLALEMENNGIDFDTFFTTAKYNANLQNNWLQIVYQLLFTLFHAKFYYQFIHEDLHCKNILIKYFENDLLIKYNNSDLKFNWSCQTNYLITIIDYEYTKMNNPLLGDVKEINNKFLESLSLSNTKSLFYKVSQTNWQYKNRFNLIDADIITFFTWTRSYKIKFESEENQKLYQDFVDLIYYYQTSDSVDFRTILKHDIFVKNKIVNFFYFLDMIIMTMIRSNIIIIFFLFIFVF